MAPLFLVVSVLVLTGGVRLEAVGRRWGIPVMTLRLLAAVAGEFPGGAGMALEAGRTGSTAR